MLALWGVTFTVGVFLAVAYCVVRHRNDPGEKEFPVNNFAMKGKNILNYRANRKVL